MTGESSDGESTRRRYCSERLSLVSSAAIRNVTFFSRNVEFFGVRHNAVVMSHWVPCTLRDKGSGHCVCTEGDNVIGVACKPQPAKALATTRKLGYDSIIPHNFNSCARFWICLFFMSLCTFFFVVWWAWGKQLRKWWRSHNDVVVWMWRFCVTRVVPRSPRRCCYRTKTSGQRLTFRAGGLPFKTQRSVRGVYRFSPYRTENGLLPIENPVLKAVTSLRRLFAGRLRRMPGFHCPVSP